MVASPNVSTSSSVSSTASGPSSPSSNEAINRFRLVALRGLSDRQLATIDLTSVDQGNDPGDLYKREIHRFEVNPMLRCRPRNRYTVICTTINVYIVLFVLTITRMARCSWQNNSVSAGQHPVRADCRRNNHVLTCRASSVLRPK